MFRFAAVVVVVAIGSAAYAQNEPRPRHHKAAPAAAQNQDDTKDITAVPQHVQKWIGGAVDDILTGADKALEPGGKP